LNLERPSSSLVVFLNVQITTFFAEGHGVKRTQFLNFILSFKQKTQAQKGKPTYQNIKLISSTDKNAKFKTNYQPFTQNLAILTLELSCARLAARLFWRTSWRQFQRLVIWPIPGYLIPPPFSKTTDFAVQESLLKNG